MRLILTRLWVSVVASAALLACVTWVNVLNAHSSFCRLVLDKRLETGKAPGVQPPSLLFLGLDSGSNICEVFEGYYSALLNRTDNTFRQNVVTVLAETFQLAGQLLEMSFGRMGSLSLQGSTKSEYPIFNMFPVFLSKELICAGDCWAFDTQIDSDNFAIWLSIWKLFFDNDMKPQSAAFVLTEVGGCHSPCQIATLVGVEYQSYPLSPIYAGEGGVSILEFDIGAAGVVPDGASFGFGARDLFLFSLKCAGGSKSLRSFEPGGNNQLGWQVGLLSFRSVGRVMQLNAIDSFFWPTYLTHTIEGVSELPYRGFECCILLWFGLELEFDCSGCFHNHIVALVLRFVKSFSIFRSRDSFTG